MPEDSKSDLQSRMFPISIKEISGERFDPLYWKGSIYGGIEKTKFPFVSIKQFSKYLLSGFAAGHSDQNISGEGIIQIRPTNISENRDLVFSKNIYIDFSKKEELKNDLLIKGEVLFNNTNSQELVGKTAFFNLDGDFLCSNHITRIGLTKKCNAIYLTAVLNLYQRQKVFYKSCINWNNQSGINIDILKKLKIPFPSIEIQNEIANYITDIMQKAQQLKDDIKDALQRANKEIENILLKEENV